MNGLFDKAVGKIELGVLSGDKIFFELIAKCHQCINFGDDASLLGERWKRKGRHWWIAGRSNERIAAFASRKMDV